MKHLLYFLPALVNCWMPTNICAFTVKNRCLDSFCICYCICIGAYVMFECNMYVLMLCLGIPDIDNELFKTECFISENMFACDEVKVELIV